MKTTKLESLVMLLSWLMFLPIVVKPQDDIKSEIKKYTANLPFRMPEVNPPVFPDKDFNVIDYGAVNDGLFKNTLVFNKAIEECSSAGGGRVIIPSGIWLTGPIKLLNNVNLHLQKGALVIFSPDHNDYDLIAPPGSKTYNCAAPIYGFNLNNIAITGDGLLDGNGQTWRPIKKSKLTAGQWKELLSSGGEVSADGDTWWPTKQALDAEKYLSTRKKSELTKKDYEAIKDYQRPNLLYLVNCKNVLIDGITLQNSPRFHLYFSKSENGIIRNVKVLSEWWAQNGDGLDIISSKNVIMYNCTVNTGDDGICMKSSKDKEEIPSLQNIVISDCVVYHAHGGFVIGSNTDGGMRNISVRNCNFINTDVGLRFKSGIGRGGIVDNIFIEDIFLKDIQNEAILFDLLYIDTGAAQTRDTIDRTKIPLFRNIHMKNIFCDGAKQAFLVKTTDNFPVKDISLSNAVIKSKKGFEANESHNFSLNNVKIISKKSPLFKINQCSEMNFINVFCPEEINTFMQLSGKDTKQIRVGKTDYSKAKIPFNFSDEVNKSAIVK